MTDENVDSQLADIDGQLATLMWKNKVPLAVVLLRYGDDLAVSGYADEDEVGNMDTLRTWLVENLPTIKEKLKG